MPGAKSRIAAIVFRRDEDPDPAVLAFIEAARIQGARVAGLVQEHGLRDECGPHRVYVRDIDGGFHHSIMQDLGRSSSGCSVDPEAIALAAVRLGAAVDRRPNLLVVNRFGRLESEGGGMVDEIGGAVVEDIPLLICVSERYLDAWNAFADGLDVKLPPDARAVQTWWAQLAEGSTVSA